MKRVADKNKLPQIGYYFVKRNDEQIKLILAISCKRATQQS